MTLVLNIELLLLQVASPGKQGSNEVHRGVIVGPWATQGAAQSSWCHLVMP